MTNLCSWRTLWSWVARLAIFSLSVYVSHKVKVKLCSYLVKRQLVRCLRGTIDLSEYELFTILPASQAILVTPEGEI